MTTLVLLVLIAIWAAVLISPLLRARADGGFGDSIGTFRRHLSVIERAAPIRVLPANRLRLPHSASVIRGRTGDRPGGRRGATQSAATVRRHKLQRRRRDVLFTLLAGAIGSLLLGLIPGLSMLLFVCAGFVLLLAGYIGLLVRLRTLATERAMKLRFLPASAPAQMALAVSAAERQRGAVSVPDEYGSGAQMLMRRPAN